MTDEAKDDTGGRSVSSHLLSW